MEVFITKYALSKGIYSIEVEDTLRTPTMVRVTNAKRYPHLFSKPHWHLTKKEAIEQANKMKIKRIKSLEKQLDKLKKMKF